MTLRERVKKMRHTVFQFFRTSRAYKKSLDWRHDELQNIPGWVKNDIGFFMEKYPKGDYDIVQLQSILLNLANKCILVLINDQYCVNENKGRYKKDKRLLRADYALITQGIIDTTTQRKIAKEVEWEDILSGCYKLAEKYAKNTPSTHTKMVQVVQCFYVELVCILYEIEKQQKEEYETVS